MIDLFDVLIKFMSVWEEEGRRESEGGWGKVHGSFFLQIPLLGP